MECREGRSAGMSGNSATFTPPVRRHKFSRERGRVTSRGQIKRFSATALLFSLYVYIANTRIINIRINL